MLFTSGQFFLLEICTDVKVSVIVKATPSPHKNECSRVSV